MALLHRPCKCLWSQQRLLGFKLFSLSLKNCNDQGNLPGYKENASFPHASFIPFDGVKDVTRHRNVPCFIYRTLESILETFLPEWHSGRNWNVTLLTGIWRMFIQTWSQSTTLWAMEEYVSWNRTSGFKYLTMKGNGTWITWQLRKAFPKSILPRLIFLPPNFFLRFCPWALSVYFHLLLPRPHLFSLSLPLVPYFANCSPKSDLSVSQPAGVSGLASLFYMCCDSLRVGFPRKELAAGSPSSICLVQRKWLSRSQTPASFCLVISGTPGVVGKMHNLGRLEGLLSLPLSNGVSVCFALSDEKHIGSKYLPGSGTCFRQNSHHVLLSQIRSAGIFHNLSCPGRVSLLWLSTWQPLPVSD